MSAALIALLLLAAPEGQAAFEAATAIEAKGDYKAAADALEKLARDKPADPYADDALFEAALLSEERLADPARAARLYGLVVEKYPQSRLSRRARARYEFLTASLSTGEEPLKEYQSIVSGVGGRPVAESLQRMEKLLAEHKNFAVADRALYWLGSTYATERRVPEAMAKLSELEQRFPSSEWSARAKKLRGDLLLRAGRTAEARAAYQSLAKHGDLLSKAAAEEGLAATRSFLLRRALLFVAIGYLLLFFALHAWALRRVERRHLWPTEVLFYLPVAALFIAAGVSENGSIAIATSAIAVGGALIIWVATALFSAKLPPTWAARLGRLASTSAAVIAVAYVAVHTTGLTDLILETLHNGPER